MKSSPASRCKDFPGSFECGFNEVANLACSSGLIEGIAPNASMNRVADLAFDIRRPAITSPGVAENGTDLRQHDFVHVGLDETTCRFGGWQRTPGFEDVDEHPSDCLFSLSLFDSRTDDALGDTLSLLGNGKTGEVFKDEAQLLEESRVALCEPIRSPCSTARRSRGSLSGATASAARSPAAPLATACAPRATPGSATPA
jgi:hypothetical protein